MNFFYMIAPFLLIIFGSLDFFKIIVNGDPKTIQKNRSNFFKRIIAFVLLYFTPFITKQILSLSTYDLTGSHYICSVQVSSPYTSNASSSTILYSGVYGIDNSIYDSESSSSLLKAADDITKTWSTTGFVYFDGSHSLKSGDIKGSINNSTKGTCCATLVAAALYKSNLVSEAEINSIPYNGAYYIADLLDGKGWKIIDSYDSLKPGDVVFMTSDGNAPVTLSNGRTYNQGHVQIYAGNGRWYNAGSTDAIQRSQPYSMGDDYVKGRFSFALRTPETNRRRSSGKSSSSSTNAKSTTPTTQTTETKSTTTDTKSTNTKSTTTTSTTKATTGTKSTTTTKPSTPTKKGSK